MGKHDKGVGLKGQDLVTNLSRKYLNRKHFVGAKEGI